MARTVVETRPGLTIWNKGLLALALVASLVFIIGFVLPYARFNPEALGVFWPKRTWLAMHLAGGTVAILVGPFALWLGLTRRRLAVHRRLGMVYMASIVISVIGSFYLSFHTDVNWVFGMGLTGLGVAWVVTTGLAFLAIKKRLIAQHQEWMIRSYVVTLGFVNFRILVGILQVSSVGTLEQQLTAASWFSWSFPLLVTEAILQGRKIFAN